jgi:membrane protease YdiL (CAAX protease family)
MAAIAWVRAHPLAVYLVWQLSIGWALALIPAVAKQTVDIDLPLQPFVLASTWLGMLVPAVVITGVVDGKEGVRQLGRRLLPQRASLGWYLLTLLAVPLTAVGIAVMAFGQPTAAPATFIAALVGGFVVQAVLGLLTNSLWEEVAVMGFVQARLQVRRGAVVAAALTAVVATLQHLPILGANPLQLILVTALFVPYRALTGWFYNRTGSLLLVGLLHAASNAVATGAGFGTGLLPRIYVQADADELHIFAEAILGLVVIVATRGRLGLRASRYLSDKEIPSCRPSRRSSNVILSSRSSFWRSDLPGPSWSRRFSAHMD